MATSSRKKNTKPLHPGIRVMGPLAAKLSWASSETMLARILRRFEPEKHKAAVRRVSEAIVEFQGFWDQTRRSALEFPEHSSFNDIRDFDRKINEAVAALVVLQVGPSPHSHHPPRDADRWDLACPECDVEDEKARVAEAYLHYLISEVWQFEERLDAARRSRRNAARRRGPQDRNTDRRLKAALMREAVLKVCDDEDWTGSSDALSVHLQKKHRISRSPATLRRYLQGTRFARPQRMPKRSAKGRNEREAVACEPTEQLEVFTMPDDS